MSYLFLNDFVNESNAISQRCLLDYYIDPNSHIGSLSVLHERIKELKMELKRKDRIIHELQNCLQEIVHDLMNVKTRDGNSDNSNHSPSSPSSSSEENQDTLEIDEVEEKPNEICVITKIE